MKNFSIGCAKAMMLVIATATTAIGLESAPVHAANLSFTGNLANPDDISSFFFTADGTSNVTIRSYSYSGGTNAVGTVITAGGFDPILTLFNGTTGNYILDQEDIGINNLDFQLSQVLPAGEYRAVISAFANFAVQPNFADGFTGGGDFFGLSSAYAVDILNVNNQDVTAIPEPTDLIGTVVAGLGAIMFKRKLSSGKKANLNIQD